MWTRSHEPLALRVDRKVKPLQRSRAENSDVAPLGEYNFVHGEELVEANYRKADAARYLLAVRHHKR